MMHTGRARLHHALVPVAAILLLGACGDDPLPAAQTQPSTSGPASTAPVSVPTTEPNDPVSTPAVETTLPPEPLGEWVNVTGNLAGLESYCGNLSYVSARPAQDEVLVNVVGQGLFVNDGTSGEWSPFGRGEGSAPLDHRTSSIAYDPEDTDRFWESGYFGLGPPPNARASNANRTDDGGATFLALARGEKADGISVDFTDPERRTLLLGLRAQERALVSDDGGASWRDVSATLPDDLGEASFPLVLDAQTFLLGSHRGDRRGGASPAIFRTTDAGATWTKVFDQGVSGQPLVADDGGIYWVLEDGGVVGSIDDGASWTVVTDQGPSNGRWDARRNGLVETSDGTWLSMSPSSMLVSSDRGVTWYEFGSPFPFASGLPADGFTYSESQGAVYIWQKWCDFAAGVNPVRDDAIYRLEVDLSS